MEYSLRCKLCPDWKYDNVNENDVSNLVEKHRSETHPDSGTFEARQSGNDPIYATVPNSE